MYLFGAGSATAQCAVTSVPTYTFSCLTEYVTSITASGTGITSTIAVTSTGCTGTYFDNSSSQGITAPMGSTVSLSVSRYTTSYTAYLSVYVDWNNDGNYDATELAGNVAELSPITMSATYNFTVPICSAPSGTTLRMRVMLSEVTGNVGAPCNANYGQAYDFYLTLGCPASATIGVSPSAVAICPASATSPTLTASGSGIYAWSPVAGLSATTGAMVIATPTVTTVYTVSGNACSGCTSSVGTATVVVNATPSAITGPTVICAGSDFTLSNAAAGGTWSSSNPSMATVNAVSGIVHGIAAGTVTISYATGIGACVRTLTLTVNPLPAAISGGLAACTGATTTLTDAVAGGTWSSSSTAVATITAGGVLHGVLAGTTNISYTVSGCAAVVATVTVSTTPAVVSGAGMVCVGSSITLSDASAGGTWSSGTPSKGSVSTIGVVAGLSAGTARITYTLSGGCYAVKNINVDQPAAISGASTVCKGTAIALSDATTGGTWASSTTAVATIVSSGTLTGVTVGSATISYTDALGCTITTLVAVRNSPVSISGPSLVCIGGTASLSDATGSGTWASTATGIATISSAGLVSGLSAGTSTIIYTLSDGCSTATNISVTGPTSISGNTIACIGVTSTLSDAAGGGTWTSSNTSVATIGTSGTIIPLTTGTTTITYNTSVCSPSVTVTVYPMPAAIGGASLVCIGSVISITDGTFGGSWSSGNTAVATVDGSGDVTGVAAGSVTITYSFGGPCIATKNITVNALTAISGPLVACIGSTATLTNTTAGGTWSSTVTSVATISSAAGVVTPVSAGTTTISYITGCLATAVFTVYPLPGGLGGTSRVCVGAAITLTDGIAGGAWSSSNTSVATVDGSGDVTGVATGSARITYSFGGVCTVTKSVTVDALTAISGSLAACMGSTVTLTNATAGGAWSSSATSVATISGSTGVVTQVSAGTTTISYVTGCLATSVFTVYPMPSAISGALLLCTGSMITLTDSVAGGAWSSSNTSLASVDGSGVITGVSAGSVTITYSFGGICSVTKNITVNAFASIMGTTGICTGSSTSLSDAVPGGTWSSTATSVATISSAGVVTAGSSAGTTTISYSDGCVASLVVTVFPTPGAISGVSSVCTGGASLTLSDAPSGGIWSSSNSALGSVSPSGTVAGLSAGTITISYSFGGICTAAKVMTVYATPETITGSSSVCIGSTTALSNTVAGGSWSSSNTAKGTVSTAGLVYGVSAGTTTISYNNGGCVATVIVTVSGPSPIAGASVVCTGNTISLSDASAGGTWSSDATYVATVSSAGIVTGILAPGGADISYTILGCSAVINITVRAMPAAISGSSSMCNGINVYFSDAVSGGTWTSSNSGVVSVDGGGGFAAPGSVGTATITYSFGSPCFVTKAVTVNISPAAITGVPVACTGSTTTLTDATSGGTWSSSSTGIATISGGIVSGVSGGTSLICYAVGSCSACATVSVYQMPVAISGSSTVCGGATITLTDAISDGSWSSSNSSVASVNSGGVVTGMSAGTATISYSTGGTCTVTKTITVISPASITGTTSVCAGSATTLNDATSGGTWSSSNTSVATISSGVVTGVAAGTTTISYIVSGCATTTTITVYAAPTAISGSSTVCASANISLSDGVSGGSWSSSNTTKATVDAATGVVTGQFPGTAIISYTLAGGCSVTKTITVSANPGAITGSPTICLGGTTSLSDATTGGTWSSSNTAVGTVSGGVVAGLSNGTTTITYTSSGCFSIATITVLGPSAISGASVMCSGATNSFSDAISGGTWSCSNTSIATVDASSGAVTNVASGTATISYVISVCSATYPITVHTMPGTINGTAEVCTGSSTTLSNTVSGGTWSSSNTSLATINASTGVVNGISPGTITISYTTGTPCSVATTVTVNQMPSAISGTAVICGLSSSTTLSDTYSGGVWSVSPGDASYASVSSSGVVTSGSSYPPSGFVTVYYTIGSCVVSISVAIHSC